MRDVLDRAEKLAEAIFSNERFIALRKAEKAVQDNPDAKTLLDSFTAKTFAILEKERAMQPVEPEEKRELMALKEGMATNPLLQELNRAQADWAEMMNKVNNILFQRLETRPESP